MNKKQTTTACVFVHKDGKALIAKRAKTKKFLPDKWELPGGHVEWGETIKDALIREMNEEFHIDIELSSLSPYYAFTYVYKNEHVIEVEYFAHMINPNQEISTNANDHSGYKWISKEEIDNYFSDNDNEKIAIKKGFELITLFL